MTQESGRPRALGKCLSRTDVGASRGHQAGMYIPKNVVDFFPALDPVAVNPRRTVRFTDDAGRTWDLEFIYYNNRQRGGTRNEYRLTHTGGYFREYGLGEGDEIVLSRDGNDDYRIRHRERETSRQVAEVLKLGSTWKVIKL